MLSSMELTQALSSFYQNLEELYRLRCVDALIGWDQQVFMPPNASQGRAEQQETLGKLIHQRFTAKDFVTLVQRLHDNFPSLNADDQVNVRETKRHLDRALKLPDEFVAEKTKITSLTFSAWTKARAANDFASVKPLLEKIVELSRKEAELIGYEEHPYDALLDAYEPYAKLSQVRPMLLSLAQRIQTILPEIEKRYSKVPEIQGDFQEDKQVALNRKVAGALGYDFAAGRLDPTHHPFMTSIGAEDVRICTRFNKRNYASALYATIHETGHALYELGLPPKWKGTPLGSAVSLGIHESQSRLWENLVGRSQPFCSYLHSLLEEFYPELAKGQSVMDLWRSVNRVRRTLIRVEADEVSYSLHVVIRLLLEERLISGQLKVADLPAAWNEQYRTILNLEPPDNKDGVLQDVHWFGGMIGYFPTYALGNIYGAALFERAREQIQDLDAQIAQGKFSTLLTWLRENVHAHGMRFRAEELVSRVTGRTPSIEPFMNYLENKFLKEAGV